MNFFLASEKDVKSLVLKTLSEKFPLSAKEMHKKISADYRNVSYQAVHKTLCQLADEEVLLKDSKGKYQVSEKWIQNAKGFVNSLEKFYGPQRIRFVDLKEGDSTSLAFDKAGDIYYWIMDEIEELTKRKEFYKPSVMRWSHMWPATMVEKTRYIQLVFLMVNHSPRVICSNKTAFDEMIAAYWNKMRGKAVFKEGKSRESDLLVYADYVVEVFWPKNFRKTMDKYYGESRKDMGIATNNIYKLNFEQKFKIPMTITKNKVLAQQIRKEVLEEFKK